MKEKMIEIKLREMRLLLKSGSIKRKLFCRVDHCVYKYIELCRMSRNQMKVTTQEGKRANNKNQSQPQSRRNKQRSSLNGSKASI